MLAIRTCLVVGLAGCAGADAMTLPSQPQIAARGEVAYHPGENMSYEVQLGGVLVGEAQLAVGDIGTVDGRRAIVVKSRAATAGVAAVIKKMVDESTTVIDVETGRPMRVDTFVVAGDKTTTASSVFAGTSVDVTFQRGDEKPQHMKIDFKSRTSGLGDGALHDMHSAMAQLRGWRATPGTTKTVYLLGGRRLWRIDVKYVGEETIGSKVGNRRAIVYEGTSYRARRDLQHEQKPTRTFRVWMSDDADRVPLRCSAKTELGDIIMDLIDYNRP